MPAGVDPTGGTKAVRQGAQLAASSAPIIARRSAAPISSAVSSAARASGGKAGQADRLRRAATCAWAAAT